MNNIKLTLTQWAILALVVIIGILIVALKLQGSRLHLLKLQLMQKDLDISIKKDDNSVKEKKKALKEAKKDLRRK